MSLSFAFLLSVYIGNGELPGWARGDAKRAQNFKKVRHLLFDMEVSKIQGNPPGSLTCFGVLISGRGDPVQLPVQLPCDS